MARKRSKSSFKSKFTRSNNKGKLLHDNKPSSDIKQYIEQFKGALSDRYEIIDYLQNKAPKYPELPKYLTHCTYRLKTDQILRDKRFGGREILSGSLFFTPSITHFSITPFLIGNFNEGLIFDTEKLQKRNSKKKIFPTIYKLSVGEQNPLYAYFDESGWNQFPREVAERSPEEVRIVTHSTEEREWNMDNPIAFTWDDIAGYILEVGYVSGRGDKEAYFNDLFLDLDNPISLTNYNRIRSNSYHSKLEDPSKIFQFHMEPLFPEGEAVIVFKGRGKQTISNFVKAKSDYYPNPWVLNKERRDEMFDEYMLITKEGTFVKKEGEEEVEVF